MENRTNESKKKRKEKKNGSILINLSVLSVRGSDSHHSNSISISFEVLNNGLDANVHRMKWEKNIENIFTI